MTTQDFPGWTVPLAHGRRWEIRRPLVMAILNATPDSFSDGGLLPSGAALQAAIAALVAEGADILDVGGESTRPGHKSVAADEEVRRVLPVIAAIRRVAPTIPVSIDTRKASVAKAALAAGADFVNDVSGLADPAMASVVRNAGCAVVLMRDQPIAGDIVAGCRAQLEERAATARTGGIQDSAIILDPGLGFGDPPGGDVAANLRLITCAEQLGLGRPVLVGASRKRFLGTMTGEGDAARRVGASVAAALLAVQAGAAIVRVHDVAETVQALRVLAGASALRATG